MQTAKQLSVSLVNKPGRLAGVLAALNKEKVAFRALSVMDSGDRGTVRFVPEDAAKAIQVLNDLNMRHDAADVLLVEVPAQQGGFRKVCERLASEHLNIDYAYCSFAQDGAKRGCLAVIKVNDLAKAQRVLGENGGAAVRKAAAVTRKKLPVRRPMHAR